MENVVKWWSGTMQQQVRRYSIDEFEQFNMNGARQRDNLESTVESRGEDVSRYFDNENEQFVIQAVRHLIIQRRIQDIIISGSCDGYRSRSERDMACIVTLSAHYNFRTIRAIFSCTFLGVSDRIQEKGIQTLVRDYIKARDFIEDNPEDNLGDNIEQESHRFNLKELMETELPDELEWIGGGILPKHGYQIIGGDAKEGKTTFVLQEALSLITKHPFLGRFPIIESPKVLYIYAEGTLNQLQSVMRVQIAGARRHRWIIDDDCLEKLVFADGRRISLNSQPGFLKLQSLIEQDEADICILDPISLFYTGNLDKMEKIAKVTKQLSQISSVTGVTWVIVHHYNKSVEKTSNPLHKLSGSAAWGNFCESFIGIAKAHMHRSDNLKKLEFVLRRAAAPGPIAVERCPRTRLYSVIPEGQSHRSVSIEQVVDELRTFGPDGANYTLITRQTAAKYGVTSEYIYQLLREARGMGLVRKDEGTRGKWHAI